MGPLIINNVIRPLRELEHLGETAFRNGKPYICLGGSVTGEESLCLIIQGQEVSSGPVDEIELRQKNLVKITPVVVDASRLLTCDQVQ